MIFMTIFGREAELTPETYAKLALLDFKINLWDIDSALLQNADTIHHHGGRWFATDVGGVALFSLGGFATAEEAALAGIKYYTAGNKP